jgi:hypothetical protein
MLERNLILLSYENKCQQTNCRTFRYDFDRSDRYLDPARISEQLFRCHNKQLRVVNQGAQRA